MIRLADSIEFLAGDTKIDSEHLELIGMINLINHYSEDRKYDFQLPSLIIVFSSKLQSHFHSEEEVMTRLGYPSIAEHKLAHKKLISTTVELLNSLTDRSNNVAQTFEEMLVDHTKNYDLPCFEKMKNELQKKKD